MYLAVRYGSVAMRSVCATESATVDTVTCIYVCMYMRIYMCMYVYISTYIYIYI